MTTPRDQIFSRKSLLAFGMTHHSIARAVDGGDLVHIRRGWYASPTAAVDAVRAVRVGGIATALSATRLWGIWTPPDETLHVAVPSNAGRLRHPAHSTTRSGEPALCLHWRRQGEGNAGVASVMDALMDAVQCQTEERAVVVIDSALNAGLVSLRQLDQAFAHAPRRYARALSRADARSQSGIETIVRLRLRARGIRVSVQVRISGVGHVDLLVGDRFVIECDSKAWHAGDDRYFEDRRRDRVLIGLDYLPMRITYEMVMFDWAATERVILRRVAQRDHLWPRRSKTGRTASRRAKTHGGDGSS